MALYIPNICVYLFYSIFIETICNSDYAAWSEMERMWKKAAAT